MTDEMDDGQAAIEKDMATATAVFNSMAEQVKTACREHPELLPHEHVRALVVELLAYNEEQPLSMAIILAVLLHQKVQEELEAAQEDDEKNEEVAPRWL